LSRFREALYLWVDRNFVKVVFSSVALTLSVIVLWPQSVVSIPAGHAGVLWSRFFGGTVMDRIYKSGTHVMLPWDIMTIYDLRVQIGNTQMGVLTSDGLLSNVDIAFRFFANSDSLTAMHNFVGPNYLDKLLVPDVASQARSVFANYLPDVAFTAKRTEIENEIARAVDRNLIDGFNPPGYTKVRFVQIEDVLIRSVKLPEPVEQAIERKVTEYHRAQQYEFTLQAERQEAVRKEVEADGIRRFQDIVRPGLTDSYLRWRGVEATLSLAQSPNSKVVIFGSGPGGLPVILGNLEDSAGKVKAAEKSDKLPAKPATQGPAKAPPAPAALKPPLPTMPKLLTLPLSPDPTATSLGAERPTPK